MFERRQRLDCRVEAKNEYKVKMRTKKAYKVTGTLNCAFTNKLRSSKNCCTTKSLRWIDVVWSNLGHECPRYMNHKDAIPRRMDIHVRGPHQPASPVEKLLYDEKPLPH